MAERGCGLYDKDGRIQCVIVLSGKVRIFYKMKNGESEELNTERGTYSHV